MKIVLTHLSPDFDAIASAYAACKLHGCDHIAVISNLEPNVFDFLSSQNAYIPIKNYSEKDISDVSHIEEIIITDCKLQKRLGKLAALIEKADIVTIYDHHPAYSKDIKATNEFVKNYGSCTTILVKILQEKAIPLSRFEATLLAMGIYEDTGLLTFKSTVPEDAQSVSYLLESGAETSVISDFIKRDLNRVQVFILNELLLNLSMLSVGDANVGISFASSEEYVDEMAYIAQRLMTMEGLEALFVLISAGGRIILIGRSRTSNIDVSSVISEFGGGGHPFAASAIIKEMLLPEAIDRIKYIVREKIRPVKIVSEIMNSPVKFVESGTLFSEAQDITMKYNLNHMPVVSGNKTIGIISRKDILDGIKHRLHSEPVNDIMQVEFDIVTPITPFHKAEEIMVCKGQELLPVEDESGLVGVVTRTDLLRLMHEEITLRGAIAEKVRTDKGLSRSRNIASIMKDNLPKNLLAILEDLGRLAEKNNVKVYVVGGFVRDIIMKNANFDIDIVVEGDAAKFAKIYARNKKGKVSEHSKFKTAVVTLSDGFKIDFATARTEYYMTPAAAPEVEEASIKNDLYRRDFTINAMAVRLDGAQFGSLLDFFSGQRDINEKKIRALHSLSFVDDPSRAFRAIRFSVRFSFNIGEHTERLIKHAESLNLFGRVLGLRLFLELEYILDEKGYLKALEMMKKYNLLRFYSPSLAIDNMVMERFERLDDLLTWYKIQQGGHISIWFARFCVLFFKLQQEPFSNMLDLFNLSEKLRSELESTRKYIEYAINLFKREGSPKKPSFIYKICSSFSNEGLLALGACHADMIEHVKEYITNYSNVKISLNGSGITALGAKRGPIIKTLLDGLLIEKLDGNISSADDEKEYVINKLKEI